MTLAILLLGPLVLWRHFSVHVLLRFLPNRLYKMAVGFMLAHPYGFTRVMSSYRWPRYFENGVVSVSQILVCQM